MTLVFMSIVSAVIAERVQLRAGLFLLPLLLIIGMPVFCSGTQANFTVRRLAFLRRCAVVLGSNVADRAAFPGTLQARI